MVLIRKIKCAAKGRNHQTKKLKKATYEPLDKALLKWFKWQSLNIPGTGPILKIKAGYFANLLRIENYDFFWMG